MNRFSLPRPDARQCRRPFLRPSAAGLLGQRRRLPRHHQRAAKRRRHAQYLDGRPRDPAHLRDDAAVRLVAERQDPVRREATTTRPGASTGYIDNPVACSGNSKFQVVSLEKLHMGKIDAYSCKQADGQGACTRWDTYMAKEISYGFVLKDGGSSIPSPGSPTRRAGRPRRPPHCGSRRGRPSEGQRARPMPGSLKPERPSSMRPLKRRRKLSAPAR